MNYEVAQSNTLVLSVGAESTLKKVSFQCRVCDEKSRKNNIFSFNSSVLFTGCSHYKAKFICSLSRKEPNARHARKSSRNTLCSQVASNVPQSAVTCRSALVVKIIRCSGTRSVLRYGVNITAHLALHVLAFS